MAEECFPTPIEHDQWRSTEPCLPDAIRKHSRQSVGAEEEPEYFKEPPGALRG